MYVKARIANCEGADNDRQSRQRASSGHVNKLQLER